MKILKSILAIALIASSSLMAAPKDKMVKSEYINGKAVPVVTLKAIEVCASKKNTTLKGSMIADETFAKPTSNIVRLIHINNKLVPLVTMKTIEVIASRKVDASDDKTSSIDNSNRIKAVMFNGELMPGVELNTAEVVASRTEKGTMRKISFKIQNFISVMFNHINLK